MPIAGASVSRQDAVDRERRGASSQAFRSAPGHGAADPDVHTHLDERHGLLVGARERMQGAAHAGMPSQHRQHLGNSLAAVQRHGQIEARRQVELRFQHLHLPIDGMNRGITPKVEPGLADGGRAVPFDQREHRLHILVSKPRVEPQAVGKGRVPRRQLDHRPVRRGVIAAREH
jgi:hypothetical protein